MGNRRPVPPQLFFGAALLPGDFPARLDRLKAACGLSWDGMAACRRGPPAVATLAA